MARRLIIDGNNVIGARPDGWWRDRAAATGRLVEQLADWTGGSDASVAVVFDGRRPEEFAAPRGRLEVVFAERPGRDAADDVIAARVANDPLPEQLDVVTSDAELAARVRAHGARVLGARGFRARLDRAASPPGLRGR
jgi:predicted RNA-binding protein with PIN domain